jgi:hypothetical protein
MTSTKKILAIIGAVLTTGVLPLLVMPSISGTALAAQHCTSSDIYAIICSGGFGGGGKGIPSGGGGGHTTCTSIFTSGTCTTSGGGGGGGLDKVGGGGGQTTCSREVCTTIHGGSSFTKP